MKTTTPSSSSKQVECFSSSFSKKENSRNGGNDGTMMTGRIVVTSSKQGPREYLEDFHSSCVKSGGRFIVFGVFDGHGGTECAEYCAATLCRLVTESSEETLRSETGEVLSSAFVKVDEDFRKQFPLSEAGSTATVCVLDQDEMVLTVANVGDSAAVVVKSNGRIAELTKNHHGKRPDERSRIKALGGTVEYDRLDKVYRVGGILAVTRAIGDAYLKPYLTAVPEVSRTQLSKENDAFLVVGSDGLWDYLDKKKLGGKLLGAAVRVGDEGDTTINDLVDMALSNKGDDNVTLSVMDLRRF